MSSRKSYRNKMVRKDALGVSFAPVGGATIEGSLLDVHGEGAAVSFPPGSGGELRRDSRGTLRFRRDEEQPFEVSAEIRSVRAVGDRLRVGFSFRGSAGETIDWPPSLRSLFNRRGAYRVRPRGEEDLRVLIRADPEEVGEAHTARGSLVNISLTGARVRLDEPLSWEGRSLRVRVTFALPESRLRVMIGAVLRNTCAEATHVGLEFESDGRRFGVNQKEVREYIMQRQREDLRRMSWLKE